MLLCFFLTSLCLNLISEASIKNKHLLLVLRRCQQTCRLKEKSDLASSFFYNIVVKTLRAIEQCVRVINHNAYIMIVIKGKNFCPAAKLVGQFFSPDFLGFMW